MVKYALKELLKDKKADEILDLTVCEPALGSGAFLNEALNQLADAYLDRKQEETHRDIPHGEIETEKQKVKAWLADNRVFGVDLNPVAVELAEISLWLNTIYQGHTIPWFGAQLAVGNSLIGARRQVFTPRADRSGRERPGSKRVPERVKPGEARPAGAVYHLLLPISGMANYSDRAVKQMTGDAMKRIVQWRREFPGAFRRGRGGHARSASVPPWTGSGRGTPRTCAPSAPRRRPHFRFSVRGQSGVSVARGDVHHRAAQ